MVFRQCESAHDLFAVDWSWTSFHNMSKDIGDHLNVPSHGCLEYFFAQMFFRILSIETTELCCGYDLSKSLVERMSCHTPRICRDEYRNEHTKLDKSILGAIHILRHHFFSHFYHPLPHIINHHQFDNPYPPHIINHIHFKMTSPPYLFAFEAFWKGILNKF